MNRLLLTVAFVWSVPIWGNTLRFSNADFTLTPVFNRVQQFAFQIVVDGPLAPGASVNPALTSVQYSVQGTLGGTPSVFPALNFQRTITGAAIYAQGSSLRFPIGPGADLPDGLQVSELSGPDPVFVFDGREVNMGRYHPPIFQLNGNGRRSIQNSKNTGGVNRVTQKVVNVNDGEEYIVNLGFAP